jgi:FolB domain-containing protein
MDQVFINDLLVRGIIGINDWEREKPQNINLNITLFADLRKAGLTDDIADSVSYRTIAKKAQAHAETSQR